MSVHQEINYSAFNHQLAGPTGSITRDLLRRGVRVQLLARRKAKADTGRLRNSITVVIRPGATGSFICEVGTNIKYAMAVHDGTGVYGPSHTPITPKRGAFLVFKPKGSSRFVFAKSVRGQEGEPFLKDALREALHQV